MLLLGFRLDNDLKLEFENNFENDLNKAFAFKFLAEFQKHQPKELNLPPSKLCSLIAKITNVSKKDLYDYLINL